MKIARRNTKRQPHIFTTLVALWVLAVTTILSNTAQAAESIWVFEDPTGQRTYEEVMANPQWFEQTSDTSRGFSDSVFWIRVELKNPLSSSLEQIVQFDSIVLPEVLEFQSVTGGVELRSNGYSVPKALRPSHYTPVRFPHLLMPDSHETLFYRIETPYKADLGLRVFDPNQQGGAAAQLMIQAAVIGAIAMLFLYNLMLAMTVRSKVYWSYTAFMLMSLLSAIAMFRFYEIFGLTADLLWWEARLGVFLYASAGWFLISLFAEQQTPTIRRLSKFYFVLVFAHLLLEPRTVIQSYSLITGPIIFSILLVIIGNAIRKGSPLAKFVMVGWTVYIAFSLLFVGNLIGVLDSKFESFFAFGNLIEGFICSMVLAYRLRLADKTETLLKEAQVELQRERLASEIGYGYKWEFDLERQMIRPDETFAAWHGRGWQAGEWYPADELFAAIPQEWQDSLAKDIRESIESTLTNPELTIQLNHPLIRQDTGASVWIQVYGKILEVDGRKLLIGTALDVTELVESKQAVDAQIEKFESLSEQAGTFFWRLDLNTNLLSYNRSFAERWGLPERGTLPFDKFGERISRKYAPLHQEGVRQVIETKAPYQTVAQAVTDELSGQWQRLQYWPIFDEQQNLVGVDFLNSNINELMQAQAELQSTLTKQKELFAIVGHELRTPVSTIKMLTEDGQINERERTQQIAEISESLLNVLEDMRVVISPERALESKTAPANPFDIVSRSLNSLKAIIAENGLSLTKNIAQGTYGTYQIHGQALRQIVTNLVKNAAIHSGGTQIAVSMEVIHGKGEESVRVRVEDNGKGIPAESLESLFEAFARGDTTKDGSGLGLFIVKQLAERLNGSIRYSKSPFGGACFTLYFPLGRMIESAAVPVIKRETSAITLEGMRVLFAEDDNTLRMLTERMLVKKGAIVTACVNGREALDAFDPAQFDLVVTDLMMPEMDGHELTRGIRATGATTRIVAVTAAVIGEETEQFMQEGANAVLSKPLRPDALVEALAKAEAEALV